MFVYIYLIHFEINFIDYFVEINSDDRCSYSESRIYLSISTLH